MELSFTFVDVRESTALAEDMSPTQFSRLMNDFYARTSDVLINTDAFIDKMVGDSVVAVFIPAFTGPHHARAAVTAARDLLVADSPLSLGIGVHTGPAFFGTVKAADGVLEDLTALGDTVNLAARLGSLASAGEALISNDAYTQADMDLGSLEERKLKVKGKRQPVVVRVLKRASPPRFRPGG